MRLLLNFNFWVKYSIQYKAKSFLNFTDTFDGWLMALVDLP